MKDNLIRRPIWHKLVDWKFLIAFSGLFCLMDVARGDHNQLLINITTPLNETEEKILNDFSATIKQIFDFDFEKYFPDFFGPPPEAAQPELYDKDKRKVTFNSPQIFFPFHFFPEFILRPTPEYEPSKKPCPSKNQCHNPSCVHKGKERKEQETIKETTKKIDFIDRNFLICVLPGLFGLIVVLTGVEIIRRHNYMVKQARSFQHFNNIQQC